MVSQQPQSADRDTLRQRRTQALGGGARARSMADARRDDEEEERKRKEAYNGNSTNLE